jgi:proteasome beta subunit
MDLKQVSESVKKGTTIVGMVCSDGVVLGADSRATAGDFIASDVSVKLHKINETTGMLFAGVMGYAQYVLKILKVQSELYSMTEGKPMSPSAAASLLGFILRESVSEMGYAGLIVGGLSSKGVPELFDLDPIGGTEKEDKYTSTGVGMASALGYLDGVYSASISAQEGIKHTAKALQLAMKRSAGTGGNMRIATITKKGFREYSKEELDKLLKA